MFMRRPYLVPCFLLGFSFGIVSCGDDESTGDNDAGTGGEDAGTGGSDGTGGREGTGGSGTGGSGTGGSGTGGAATGGSGGEPADAAMDAPPPPESEWEGTAPHLTVSGELGGGSVELSLREADAGVPDGGGADAGEGGVGGGGPGDIAVLYCERNYIVPDLEDTANWATEGYLEKIELKYNIPDFDGQPAELEIGFLHYDYTSASPMNPLSVGTADDGAKTSSDINIEVQIQLEDGTEIADEGASGYFYLEEYTGTVGADGLTIPDNTGTFGGYLVVTLSNGNVLTASFTANCGENDLETPE